MQHNENYVMKKEVINMEYANGDKGFISEFFERTLKIIKQYDEFGFSPKDNYNATLLCNCLMGILVYPEQEYYEKIDETFLSTKTRQLLVSSVKKIGVKKNSDENDIKYFFRRMRNAVSHRHVKFPKSNIKNDTSIRSICLYDDGNYKKKHNLEDYEFKLEIQIDDLKDILIEFCNNAMKKGRDTE